MSAAALESGAPRRENRSPGLGCRRGRAGAAALRGASMHGRFDHAKFASSPVAGGTGRIATRNEIAGLLRWRTAFAGERKDHRFYELVEDTLTDGFDYGYFVIDDCM